MVALIRNTAVALLLGTASLHAQQMQATSRSLSLQEALTIATRASEELRVAEASVRRAEGERIRARSQYLPQLYGSLGYTRTLKSQFEGLSGGAPADTGAGTGPDTTPKAVCAPFIAATATAAERQAALDQARSCASGGSPFDAFANLPFGQKNQWQVGVSFAQPLFSGGRIVALNAVANAGRNSAEVALASAKAQLTLDITQAYYDAVLSDRLLAIADSSLVQTESVFRQAQLAKQVGTTSEFELLRASVTRDNQRPAAIQRRSQRDVAYLRLRQLLNLPPNEAIQLTDALDNDAAAPMVRLTSGTAASASASANVMADTVARDRATVRQAADLVRIQEGLVRIARSQRLPSVSLTSQYGRVAYPASGIPSWSDFLSNWTVGVGLQVPLFTGFRIRGDEVVAQANLTEAKARLQQTTEFASLDAQVALASLEEAESAWQASLGTAGQASKAYSIAELRYREGISTQIELSESRILMQSAMANRALAARNLAIARVRLAVLRDLPLSAGGSQGGMGGAGAQSGQQQIQQYQQQQQQQQQQASQGQTSGTGGGFQQ